MSKAYRRSGNTVQQKIGGLWQKVVSRGAKSLLGWSASKIGLLTGLLLVVCAIVSVAHWPALSAQALSFDDTEYLTENVLVQNPGWGSARRFLTEVLEPSTVTGYYQPLAMLSLMTDYALGGREDNLRPFHRTSLALHVANTALVIVLIYLLFGRAPVAAVVGLLFGLHPMTAETIPWVGERKTLLAAFFALWCLILYVRYTRKGDWRFYVGCIVMYVLALMSKPTSMPLPVLMLLTDFWPLKRLKWRAILEKLPFFAVGGIFVVVTYVSQDLAGGVTLPSEYGPQRIPLILCHNIIFYLYKMVCPVNLSSHYAYPEPLGLSDPMVLAGVIGTCILIPLLVISLRWTRAPLTGWLFFFVAIFPTMGVVRFTTVIASDKFAYLPSVGLLMVLASFLGWFCGSGTLGKYIVRRGAVVIIVLILSGAEAVATRRQLAHWHDTASLYEHMLTLSTPDVELLHYNLADILVSQGKLDEAISHYRQALEVKPDYSEAHYNLGLVFASQGRLDEAVGCYRQALRFKPDDAEAHNNLGIALVSQGRLDEAISQFRQALQARPDYAEAHYNLGLVFALQNKFDEAVIYYRQALKFEPDDATTHHNLGILLASQGKFDEAISHYRQTLRAEPEHAEARYNLGLALAMTNQPEAALKHFREAVRLKPDWPAPLVWMARILATYPEPKLRDTSQAIELAERAAKLTSYRDATVLETLAAAYAATNQLDRAMTTAQAALKLASDAQDDELANRLRKRLELYRQAKP